MDDSYLRKEGLPAIPQVKTVIVINNFIANTTAFLNLFAQVCEAKLAKVSQRLGDVELILALLEAKLDSVPGIADQSPPAEERHVPSGEEASPGGEDGDLPDEEAPEPEQPGDEGLIPIRLHPDYERFFRLKKHGVPENQIRLRMQADRVDPDAIDDPDKLVPRPPIAAQPPAEAQSPPES